jgi:hypothetical protein
MYVPASSPARSQYRQLKRRPLVLTSRSGRGIGALSPQNQTIASVAQAGASSTIGTLVALGTIGGPVGAALAGLVAVGMALAQVFGGCGQTCVQASNIANQVEPILQNNVTTYLASPIRYVSMQKAAANNFMTAWQALTQNCGNPALQSAGQRCISDRQRGACVWKTSPGGWQQAGDGSWSYVPSGPAGSGSECWNWFVGYLDPILNDPLVQPDPVPGSGAASGLLSSFGIDANQTVDGIPVSDLVLPLALILAALVLL